MEVTKPIKAVVFDKDGTLIGFDFWVDVMLYRWEEMKKEWDLQEEWKENILSILGIKKENSKWSIIEDGNVFRERKIVAEELENFFYSRGMNVITSDLIWELWSKVDSKIDYQSLFTPVIPDLKKLLQELKNRGLKLAIATGDIERLVFDFLQKFSLNGLFDVVVGSDTVNASKPDPVYLEYISGKLGVKNNEILMVGDSVSDVLLAKNYGSLSAVVLTGRLNAQKASELKPDYIFTSLKELTTIL